MFYFRSLDEKVRDKRFVFVRTGDKLNAELIFEEAAVSMTNRIDAPEWEIGWGKNLAEIYEPHRLHVEKCYGLVPWEERTDVPGWAREISLVASIHCQHWTGYIFNDYEQVLENLKKFAGRWKENACSPTFRGGKAVITGNMGIMSLTNGWEEKKASGSYVTARRSWESMSCPCSG